MRRQTRLGEVTDAANQALLGSVYVSEPGSVVSYNSTTQTASVQPILQDVRFDVDTGQPFGEPWPVLQNVPVMWPRGNGACLAFGLQPNDTVSLIAWDFDPAGLIKAPGTQTVMPVDVRKLAGHAWRAIPEALFALAASEAKAAAAGGVLGLIGDVQARFVGKGVPGPSGWSPGGSVAFGPGPALDANLAQPVALAGGATGVDAFISALYTLFTTGWVPVPNDGGAALKTAFAAAFPTPPATTGATTVRGV